MRRFLLAAVAAAAVAATAAPVGGAAAGGVAGPIGCDWADGAAQFSSLSQLNGSGSYRNREPVLRNRGQRGDAEAEKVHASLSFGAAIPVYFHVITAENGEGDVTDTQIRDQITVLNLAYAGFYDGFNTPFRFRLAGIDRTANDAWFRMDPDLRPEDERAAKAALRRGGLTSLNIYSTNGADDVYLGWAYLPEDGRADPVIDGTVIHYGSVPGGFIEGFNLGHTATHEIGHWLGLYHPFDFGCERLGDLVRDTPAEAEPSFGCPEGKDTCPDRGTDPIHNFMDYSDDACYEEFTLGQTIRMIKQFIWFRLRR